MTAVSARRTVTLACFIALLHGLFFIWYQRPDWNTAWSDQAGYAQLGETLAATGTFTPAPDAPRFVPEVIRTPGYPAFVALVYRLLGVRHLWVAAAQTGLFVLICLMVFAMARRVTSPGHGSLPANSLFWRARDDRGLDDVLVDRCDVARHFRTR
jgi:hypothetical protein